MKTAIDAITTARCMTFDYDDMLRVVEVHAVGITAKGKAVIRAWQVAGESSRELPGWALFSVEKIVDPHLDTRPSGAPRHGYAENDRQMATITAQIHLEPVA